MRRAALALLVVLLSALPLTGCWSFKTLEHMTYIHSLGVDYRDGECHLYAQFANFTTISKVEGAGQSEQATPLWYGTSKGKTFNEAIFNLYQILQRRIFWSHLSAVVFTEETLRHGLDPELDLLSRYGEFRPTFWVYATKIPLATLFRSTHVIDPSPVYSKLGDPIDMNKQSSYPVMPQRLHAFIASLNEPAHTTLIPVLTVDKHNWFDEKKSYQVIKFDGYAVLKGRKWGGTMQEKRAAGLVWLNPAFVRYPLFVPDRSDVVSTIVMLKPNVKITAIPGPSEARFSIRMTVKGHFTQLLTEQPQEEMRRQIGDVIKKQIFQSYQEGLKLGADVLNLSEILYRRYPQDWKRLAKNSVLPLKPDSLTDVTVNVKIMHYGKKTYLEAAPQPQKAPGR